MDINKINISKNNDYSEDYVSYKVINSKYTVITISDGNGNFTENKSKLYNINNKLRICSEISFSTYVYTNKILNDIYLYLKNIDETFDYKIIKQKINNFILRLNNDNINICFCFLISIIDIKNLKLYTYNIGDCTYSLINLETYELYKKPSQKYNKLALNIEGNALINCPYFVQNRSRIDCNIMSINIVDLPKKFAFIQYSNGLDYDISVPITMIEHKLRRHININDYNLTNSEILKTYSYIKNKILNRDSPNTKYSKYNITNKELIEIVKTNNNSYDIINGIVNNYKNINNKRRKIDDISICVLYYTFS